MRRRISLPRTCLIPSTTDTFLVAMAKTRGSSGISAPRVPFVPTAAPQSRQTATKKKSSSATAKKPSSTTKANTSKPRAKKTSAAAPKDKTATGRVTKTTAAAAPKTKKTAATKKAPKTTNKRDPTLLDKVQGVAEKVVGVVQGKPGKKVRLACICLHWGKDCGGKESLLTRGSLIVQAAGTKKIKGTDGKGATRAKKE